MAGRAGLNDSLTRGRWMLMVMAFLSGCSTMRAEVEINAPPARVWSILQDLDGYESWNPFFIRAKGKLTPGETVELVLKPVGKSAQGFSPKVLEVEAERHICWRGRLFIPLLFDGTHHLRIEVIDPQRVRFVQEEDFSGIFVPFVGFEPYRQGWERMNAALKHKAESEEQKARGQARAVSEARPVRNAVEWHDRVSAPIRVPQRLTQTAAGSLYYSETVTSDLVEGPSAPQTVWTFVDVMRGRNGVGFSLP
jgi:hypothetical protein